MSTDDRMDERLRQAGARWRDAHTEPATVDLAAATATAAPDEDAPQIVPITPGRAERAPRRRRLNAWLATAAGVAAAVSVTLVAIQLGGDGDTGPQQPATEGRTTSLVGTDWTLKAMRAADGTPLKVVEPAPLSFDENGIGGTDACNHIGGTVTIRDGELVVGDLMMTEMACIDRPAGFDAEVDLIHAVLNGTVQWSVSGDDLTLTKPGAGTLVYGLVRHTTTADPDALIGPTWRLTTVQSGEGADGVASTPGAEVTVRFSRTEPASEQVQVAGKNGCNSVGGPATVAPGRIVFGELASTRIGCAGEPALGQVFSGEVTWTLRDDSLTISKAGVGALVFDRV